MRVYKGRTLPLIPMEKIMRRNISPRRFTLPAATLAFWVTMLLTGAASAQSGYPNKPIRLIIAFGAGAAVDTVSRILGTGLGSLGQPVIMENKPGAAGILGSELVAHAAPDGYTLLSGATAPFAIVPHITAKLSYDPLKDFTAIAPFARSASLLVINPDLPVRNMKEFIAFAKERPGKLNYASNGNGGTLHLAMEMFSSMAGIHMTHVPYNNLTLGMTHVSSGELQAMFISPTNVACTKYTATHSPISQNTAVGLRGLSNSSYVVDSMAERRAKRKGAAVRPSRAAQCAHISK